MDVVVSIIMAVFNGEKYIGSAIESVVSQTFKNWELLVIDDGSTDSTCEVVQGFKDPRVRYFELDHQGVGCARNIGLEKMEGCFFCFLDADDVFPRDSILSRLKKFDKDDSLDFVDGSVVFFAENYKLIRRHTPCFSGNPLTQLFLLNDKCFAGLTWMVKRKKNFKYSMNEKITHGEDLLFYMELARNGGNYDYIDDDVYLYRQHSNSSMRNTVALEKGYCDIFQYISNWGQFKLPYRFLFRYRSKKFMVLEYLKQKQLKAALLVLWR